MTGELVVLGLAALAAPVAAYLRHRKRRTVQDWRQAARRAGLKRVVGEASIGSTILRARAGARRVRFEAYARGRHDRGTRIVLEGGSAITLRREGPATAVQKALGGREIETGDEGFDREVYVHGREGVLRAMLDADTRRMVRGLLAGAILDKGTATGYLEAEVSVRDGDLVVEVTHKREHVLQSNLSGVMATLLAAADRLESPSNVLKQLIENTRREPEWRVRLRNIVFLAESYPGFPAALEALERGTGDEREEVQLASALALPTTAGRPTLLGIASRESAEDTIAARAVDALGRQLPLDRALAILPHALRTRRLQTARACLQVLGHHGVPAVVEPLAKVLAVETGELAVTAARGLGASGMSEAEGPLVDALREGSGDVRLAEAEALGNIGSATSVLPLKEAAAGNRLDGALRRATRQAIAEIQSRLSGASPGQLSLADGDAGLLSLADEDPRGRVSMADPGEAE